MSETRQFDPGDTIRMPHYDTTGKGRFRVWHITGVHLGATHQDGTYTMRAVDIDDPDVAISVPCLILETHPLVECVQCEMGVVMHDNRPDNPSQAEKPAPAAEPAGARFKVGDRVRHASRGDGSVFAIDDAQLCIDFDCGSDWRCYPEHLEPLPVDPPAPWVPKAGEKVLIEATYKETYTPTLSVVEVDGNSLGVFASDVRPFTPGPGGGK